MFRTLRRVALSAAVGALCAAGAAPVERVRAQEKSVARIDAAEFEKLCKELHVKNQPWASVPWKVSVTEARAAAAREKKPIFLVVNTGNCLGFV